MSYVRERGRSPEKKRAPRLIALGLFGEVLAATSFAAGLLSPAFGGDIKFVLGCFGASGISAIGGMLALREGIRLEDRNYSPTIIER